MFEERIAMSSINLYFPAIMLEKKSCGCACAAVSYNYEYKPNAKKVRINDCYQFYKVGLSYVDRYPFSLIIINLLLQLMFEERIAMSSNINL